MISRCTSTIYREKHILYVYKEVFSDRDHSITIELRVKNILHLATSDKILEHLLLKEQKVVYNRHSISNT